MVIKFYHIIPPRQAQAKPVTVQGRTYIHGDLRWHRRSPHSHILAWRQRTANPAVVVNRMLQCAPLASPGVNRHAGGKLPPPLRGVNIIDNHFLDPPRDLASVVASAAPVYSVNRCWLRNSYRVLHRSSSERIWRPTSFTCWSTAKLFQFPR